MLGPKFVACKNSFSSPAWIKLASSCILPHSYFPTNFASSSAAHLLVANRSEPGALNKSIYLIDYIRKHTPAPLQNTNKPISEDCSRLRLLIPNKYVESLEKRTLLQKFEKLNAELHLSEWRSPETVLSMRCPRNRLTASLKLLVDTLSENQEVKMLVHRSHAKAIREIKIREMKAVRVFPSRCPKSTDNVVFIYGEKDYLLSILLQLINFVEEMPKAIMEKHYNPINFNKWTNKEYGGYAHFQVPNDFCKETTLNAFVPSELAKLIETDGVKAVKSTKWLKNVQIKVDKLKKNKNEVGECNVVVTGKHEEIKGVAFVLKRWYTLTMGLLGGEIFMRRFFNCLYHDSYLPMEMAIEKSGLLKSSDIGKFYFNSSFQPTCSHCRQTGHFSRQCSHPTYCTKCTNERHLPEDCPKLKSVERAMFEKHVAKPIKTPKKPAKASEDDEQSITAKASCQTYVVREQYPQKDAVTTLQNYSSDEEETGKEVHSKDDFVNWI